MLQLDSPYMVLISGIKVTYSLITEIQAFYLVVHVAEFDLSRLFKVKSNDTVGRPIYMSSFLTVSHFSLFSYRLLEFPPLIMIIGSKLTTPQPHPYPPGPTAQTHELRITFAQIYSFTRYICHLRISSFF